MLYRGPGILAVVWFDSAPNPFSLISYLSFSVFLCVASRAYCRERGGGGVARSQILRRRESQALFKRSIFSVGSLDKTSKWNNWNLCKYSVYPTNCAVPVALNGTFLIIGSVRDKQHTKLLFTKVTQYKVTVDDRNIICYFSEPRRVCTTTKIVGQIF